MLTPSPLTVEMPAVERRTFMTASLAAAAAAPAPAAEPAGELYELRSYALKPGKAGLLDAYLSGALLPAVKRLGGGPVGVFAEKGEPSKVRVLIVHPSPIGFAALPARLADDAEYRRAGADYLAATAADPVYTRVESSILVPIAGMSRLERPDVSHPRLLNLRVYESHNERAAAKKIEMFNKGELAIFRRVGLTPVFFAAAIAGAAMPNLTYLLAFADEAARTAAWDRFRADPEWLRLKAMPEYADKEIVSKITNTILVPAAYSEI